MNIPVNVLNKASFIFFTFRIWAELSCSVTPLFGSRPPDRRRRDLFGVANATSIHSLLAGNWNLTQGNFSDDELPRQEFSFIEKKVKERSADIGGLQPFTVYRIDVHACNKEVWHCSAAAFIFSRTKAAGKSRTSTWNRRRSTVFKNVSDKSSGFFIFL